MSSAEDADKVEQLPPKPSMCEYRNCEKGATTLVEFVETSSPIRNWFCPGHAGNRIAKFDDARKLEVED